MRSSPSCCGCATSPKVDALVHMGAHGTLEWLPGKAVALTAACFPEAMVGPLPVLYPFIVSNPGEAAQAKRRIAAVTIGHLPPPLVATGLAGDAARARTAGRRICAGRRARSPAPRAPRRTDRRDRAAQRPCARGRRRCRRGRRRGAARHRCLAVRPQGPRHQGRPARLRPRRLATDDPHWRASAARRTRRRFSPRSTAGAFRAGPAGAPARGRRDVLPTGRNLYTADPRMLPTPTAMDLGRLAADEVIRELSAGAWRDAARARHRSLGQRDAAHRRRGDRPRPRADGLPADLGRAPPAASPASRCCRPPRSGGRGST